MFGKFIYVNFLTWTFTIIVVFGLIGLSTIQPQSTVLTFYTSNDCKTIQLNSFNYTTYFINNKCYNNITFDLNIINKMPCMVTMICLAKIQEYNKLARCWDLPKNGSMKIYDGKIHNYSDYKCQSLSETIELSRDCRELKLCDITSANYRIYQNKVWKSPV